MSDPLRKISTYFGENRSIASIFRVSPTSSPYLYKLRLHYIYTSQDDKITSDAYLYMSSCYNEAVICTFTLLTIVPQGGGL